MRAQMPWLWRRFAMGDRLPHRPALVHWSVLLALALPVLVFLLQRDVGLNLEDEGFVWYGAQRVLAGEVPLRDFQAYDIGRYYWYAAWMWLAGNPGIVPLRAASAVLAAVSGVIAVLLVRAGGVRQSAPSLLLAVVTFAVWMVPYFKVADSFAALLLLAGLAALLQSFSVRRCVGYGICLGVAGTIGINHGLYGVLSLGLALAWLHGTRQQAFAWRWLSAVAAGVAIGYLPMLLFLVAVPGFASAFVDGIRILFEVGMTNLELELPNPFAFWQDEGAKLTVVLTKSVMGLALWTGFGFLVLCISRLLRGQRFLANSAVRPGHAVFAAAVLTSIPYVHYVWSRADVTHMAVSALPLLVAAWTFPAVQRESASRWRTPALWLVMLTTGVLAGPQHQVYQLLKGAALEPVVVAGEPLRVRPETADVVRLLQHVVETHARGGRAIYVVPYWPGAYAVTSRRAPTWEVYQIFPASLPRQQREIERLLAADIGAALVLLYRADNRANLGFSQTHAAIARKLQLCMEPVPSAEAERQQVVLYVPRTPRCLPR